MDISPIATIAVQSSYVATVVDSVMPVAVVSADVSVAAEVTDVNDI